MRYPPGGRGRPFNTPFYPINPSKVRVYLSGRCVFYGFSFRFQEMLPVLGGEGFRLDTQDSWYQISFVPGPPKKSISAAPVYDLTRDSEKISARKPEREEMARDRIELPTRGLSDRKIYNLSHSTHYYHLIRLGFSLWFIALQRGSTS